MLPEERDGRLFGLRQPIFEEMSSLAVFDLDEPKIRIEFELLRDVVIDVLFGDRGTIEVRQPTAIQLRL